MTAPTIGAPIGPDIPHSDRRQVFDHVPRLQELIDYGGHPGVVYAQVCIHNVKRANDREERPANLRPIRGSSYYSIRGPQGSAEMALVGTGTPISGASPQGGARLFFTDGEVGMLTGLPVQYPLWLRAQEESDAEVVAVTQRAEGRKGAGRVPARHAPQREQDGTPSDEPQAGDRHRDEREPKAKIRKNLKGHTHPANFGRLQAGCPRCEEIRAQKAR